MKAAHSLLLIAITAIACSEENAPRQCEVGTRQQAVLAEDRNLLGAGGAYPANGMLRAQERELYRSQSLRRQAAWQTVAKVLAPVALAKTVPNAPASELPLWQTWYAKDDTTRLFQYLYTGLSPEQRAGRERFAQTRIDEALGWNQSEVEDLSNWPIERRDAYLAAIDSAEKLAGIGGISRVGYSPSALRHLLRSYPEILSCLAAGVPGAFADTPGQTLQQAVREPLDLAGCGTRELGPFYVGEGETLVATVSGEASDGAHVAIYSGGNPESVECDIDTPCSRTGSGAVYVAITAGARPLLGAVQIDYATPDAPWAACLESAFATDSVVIKASWSRAQFGETLPVYDTSAEGLRTTLSSNPDDGWGQPLPQADPGPDDIYTLERPNGSRYRLAGMHIMSKELEHWQWTSLWWSDTPDSDFGEDRPASITELGGPWSHYKMCTVTMFDEGDPDPAGGFSQTAPSLASALASVYGGVGAPSWCSNPYVEEGAGNMATNCIGCHQHGGTDLTSEDILGIPSGNPDLFPHFGRTQLRNNFPHDYSWAPMSGDELGLAFKSVVDFFE